MNSPVGVIGSGRLATALVPYLRSKGITVSGIWGRNAVEVGRIATGNAIPQTSDLGALVGRSKIIVFAISDDALEQMAGRLAGFPIAGRVVIHASGCLGLDVLEPVARVGGITAGIHPLMTIVSQPDVPNPLEHAPCGVACRDRLWKRILFAWLERAGHPTFALAEGPRPLYHAAAVLACAGISQVFDTAAAVMAAGLGMTVADMRRLLMPMARRTLELRGTADPVSCTGPWTRDDAGTVAMHLEALRKRGRETVALYETLRALAKGHT